MKWLGFLIALLFVVAGCSSGKDAVASGTEFVFVSPGGKTDIFYDGPDRKTIPDLSGDSLLESDKKIRLSDYPDKIIVLNIWGAWCPPCRVEAPELQKIHDAGTLVLGIDVRDQQRSAPQDFVRSRGLTYPSIYDPPGKSLLALKGYPRATVPSTIVLDRSHRVAAVYLRDLVAADLQPLIDRLTAES
jgi:thiol-disulfide isomerase/thioredoxin